MVSDISAPKNKSDSRHVESLVIDCEVSRLVIGRYVKVILKVIKCERNLSNLVVRIEVGVVSGDNEVGEELVDEFRVVDIVVCDDRDECRVDEEL